MQKIGYNITAGRIPNIVLKLDDTRINPQRTNPSPQILVLPVQK